MIDHVRTVNSGTTNTIAPSTTPRVTYNLIKPSWLLSLYSGTVCVPYIIIPVPVCTDSGHRRRVFYVLNEDVPAQYGQLHR